MYDKLKIALDIDKANCHSCANGSPDSDGEYGEIYCGMTCTVFDNHDDGPYLHDIGIDEETEKGCWMPDFFATDFDPYDNQAYEKFLDTLRDHGKLPKMYSLKSSS